MSDDRLKGCLAEQVDFLRASAARFDAGHQHEAKRLALTIRVLVHDTDGSKSLLEQLSLKSALSFLDTRTRREPPADVQVLEQLGWPTGMVILSMGIGGPTTFKAVLGSDEASRPAEVAFHAWWEESLLVSKDGTSWSRRRFILGAANQEGGAHVQPKPSAWWRDLRDGTWIGAVKVQGPAGEAALSDLAPVVIRQITYELLATLEAAGHGAGPTTSTIASATDSADVAWASLTVPSPTSSYGLGE